MLVKTVKLSDVIIKEIEKITIDTSCKQNKDFTYENRVIFVYCENPNMQPIECAEKTNQLFAQKETGNSIIEIFKRCRLGIVPERIRVFEEARVLSEKLLSCLSGNQYEIKNIELIIRQIDSHPQKKRIILNYIFKSVPELQKSSAFSYMLKMNKDFSAECIDAIITFIKIEMAGLGGKDEYVKELFRLEANLNRANKMLIKLQDEFEQRLEENRIEEQANIISMLNSSKYGYILDLLVHAQQGFKQLRTQKIDVPVAINSTPTLIRKLLQFVNDCGITQILEPGEKLEVCSADISNYTYEGTPFTNENEIKKVEVVSSGWEIKDRDIVISIPTVKELGE